MKEEPWQLEWDRFCRNYWRNYVIAAVRISFWYWHIRLKYLFFKYPGPKVIER